MDDNDQAFHLDVSNIRILSNADAAVRQRLWLSMMPTLSEADAHILATGYDFSGGQIENISRKATINAILHGEETNDLVQLTAYCNAERLDSKGNGHKIGF